MYFLAGKKCREAIAFTHLIHRKTHRIPRGSHKSLKMTLSLVTRRVYLDIFKKGNVQFDPKGDTCFYNENPEMWALDYIRQNEREVNLAAYFYPGNIYMDATFPVKVVYAVLMLVLNVISLPLLFVRPPGIWALHFTVLHEHIKILSLMKGRKIRKFYDFVCYEIGSSFLNMMLEKQGIRNHFITSPTPLYETYPDCVCDIFLSTSPYHVDEIKHKQVNKKYPLQFYFSEVRAWPYNEFDEKLEFNKGGYNNKKKIGVYASGVWWRDKEKHQEFADGFFKSEFLLLEHSRQFIESHPEFELWLFLHPRERRTKEQLEEGLAFYSKVFGSVPYKLMDFSKPTKSQFSLCDISISVSSNTTYERLFGGFKSIFAPYYLPNFPIRGNVLENMCARNYEELEKKILQFDAMTDDQFFSELGLKEYHHQYRKFGNMPVLIGEA